jgi:hypothetical protein
MNEGNDKIAEIGMEYLATKFEPDQVYNEKEINELLTHHITFRDTISLRRELIDHQLLTRIADGQHYQREFS